MSAPRRALKKVISWCLYAGDDVRFLPLFLVGLKKNIKAAAEFFPGWELWLHCGKLPAAMQLYVDEVVAGSGVQVIPNKYVDFPMVERYRPFYDPDVDVCIARDLDSVLSGKDAEIVNKWVDDPASRVLQYREYLMAHDRAVMGGGVGVKGTLPEARPNAPDESRGYDERFLDELLNANVPDRAAWSEVVLRMDWHGSYYVYSPDKKPCDSEAMWMLSSTVRADTLESVTALAARDEGHTVSANYSWAR